VILRAVFGVRDGERMDLFRERIPPLGETTSVLNWLPFFDRDLGGITPAAKFRRALAAVDELIYAEIGDRRATPGDDRDDVLSLLLRARHEDGSPMTDTELRDELLTLLTAGHETTATGLSWAFERLLRTPRVLERLTESLDDDEYVDAVVKETLRVRPVVVDVARRLTRDAEVAGWRLPAGTLVLPAIAVLHKRPDLYESPDEFRPERFMEGAAESYAWIPFGGGVRRCIGASFAQVEMRTVLREVLRRVRLRAPNGTPERGVIRHVTVVPGRGCRVVVEERLAVEPAAELARAENGGARVPDAAGQVAVRGHDWERAAVAVALDQRRDVVVGGIPPAPGREHHADAVVRLQLERPPVEHDGHLLACRGGERLQLLRELSHRARAVAPPPGGTRADDVHPIDDPAGHRRRLMNTTITPTSSAPTPSCASSATPVPSSLVASRTAANRTEAPKKTTRVQSTVSRSTGRHHTRG
jgi:hypothetical protein